MKSKQNEKQNTKENRDPWKDKVIKTSEARETIKVNHPRECKRSTIPKLHKTLSLPKGLSFIVFTFSFFFYTTLQCDLISANRFVGVYIYTLRNVSSKNGLCAWDVDGASGDYILKVFSGDKLQLLIIFTV